MAVEITGAHRDPGGPEKMRRGIRDARMSTKIAAACTAAALVASGTFLFLGLRDYREMRDMEAEWVQVSDLASGGSEEDAERFVEIPADDGAGRDEIEAFSSQAVYAPGDSLYKAVDLAALQELNPAVTGYIYVPGSQIDYPIMAEPGPAHGKYFYIDHDIYNKKDKYGSIFELCPEERGEDSPVTWIFGHHMSSGSMFSDLYKFLEEDFAATPVYIYRDGVRSEYKAFGACVIKKDNVAYSFGSYHPGTDEYAGLLDHLKEHDRLPIEDAEWPGADEPMVLLSTCYGGAGTKDRIVVLLKETRRAASQQYYDNLLDVGQYGGSTDPVDRDSVPEEEQPVDRDGALTDIEGALGRGAGTGSGTGSGTDVPVTGSGQAPDDTGGAGGGMAGILGSGV